MVTGGIWLLFFPIYMWQTLDLYNCTNLAVLICFDVNDNFLQIAYTVARRRYGLGIMYGEANV